MIFALLAAVLLGGADAAPVAEAPADPFVPMHEAVVAAIRNCPKPVEGEIIVCAGDVGAAPPWRLPKIDSPYAVSSRGESVARERERLMEGGDAGAGSCGAVGGGGWTGCTLRMIERGQDNARP